MLYPNHEKHKGFRILFCNTKHQKTGSSSQDGGVGKKPFASSHNQKEDNNQFKFNKQPEVPENQTAWNYDNQGVKETFTQTSRRGRDRQPSEQEAQQGGGPHRRGGAG